jgi:Uncharacterised nucleotidyltransferase
MSMTVTTAGFKVEHEVMSLCAATGAHREAERDRLKALLKMADEHRLMEMMRSARLLPTLGPRVLSAGNGLITQEFRSGVAASLDECRHQGALLQLISGRIGTSLSEAGIRSTSVKGPQLGEAIYDEPGRRLSSDIDMLVAPEQLSDAVEVVRDLGYAPPSDHVDDRGLPLLHLTLIHEHGELPPVELHWRIHWYESNFACDRLLAPSLDCPDDWRPAPVDEFAALLLFYARDGFTGLRQAADLGSWWDKFGTALGPNALEELMTAYPALRPALLAAAKVAERIVGLPEDRAVHTRPGLGMRGRMATRLANPYPYVSSQQLYAEIGLIDGLLTPAGGLRAFVKRQIAPPREVIREHAEKAQGTPVRTRPAYSLRVLSRYVLAMTRLLRVPAAMRAKLVP